jgi:hypothetical protein
METDTQIHLDLQTSTKREVGNTRSGFEGKLIKVAAALGLHMHRFERNPPGKPGGEIFS